MESSKYQVVGEKRAKATLIITNIKNKYVVEAYERLESSSNLKQLLFTCLSDIGKISCYSAFINEDNVFKGVMGVVRKVQQLREKETRFHGHVIVPDLDEFMNSEFQLWVQEQEETSLGTAFKARKKSIEISPTEESQQSRLSKKKALHVQHPPIQNKDEKSAIEMTCTGDVALEDNNEDIEDSPLVYSSKIKYGYVLEMFRFKKGDVGKIFDCLCKWEGIPHKNVHVINFTRLVNGIVRKAEELKRTNISKYDRFLTETFQFPIEDIDMWKGEKLDSKHKDLKREGSEVDKTNSAKKPVTPTASCKRTVKRKAYKRKEKKQTFDQMEPSKYQVVGEKRAKPKLIKTNIKNKYVVEAYELLESSSNLKQLLFTCLSDIGKISCCSAFINADNVYTGVMDVVKTVQQLREKETRFHGHVIVSHLDEFMNSEFQLWVQEQEEMILSTKASQTSLGTAFKVRKSIEMPKNVDFLTRKGVVLSSPTEKSQQSRLSKKKVLHVQHPSVQNTDEMSATEMTSTGDIALEDNNEDIEDSPLVYSSKIKYSYILEMFRFKKGDVGKIFDCLCKWEGIPHKNVHVINFTRLVNGIVRKAEELKKTDISMYDHFLTKTFQFPLVPFNKRLENMNTLTGEKLDGKQSYLKRKGLEGDKANSAKKPVAPTASCQRTFKRKFHEEEEKEGEILISDSPKPKAAKKIPTKVHPKSPEVAVEQKVRTEKSNTLRQRSLLPKKPRKRTVAELQLKMKIQYQRKLQQIIKRQNSIIVRQRKELRKMKEKQTGAHASKDNKGIQCNLISSTPQTVLVKMMKP